MQPVQNFSRSSVAIPRYVPAVQLKATSVAAAATAPKRIQSGSDCTQSLTGVLPIEARAIEEQLYVALADAKIWTSQVAMHLERQARDRLFRQLDVLHEADEWAQGDKPVSLASYQSLVRALLYHKINSRPGLSLMPTGNLLALWVDGEDKLTVEFLPSNRTRWFVQHQSKNGPERSTGTAPLERLRDVLQPYGAERWFSGS